MDLPDIKVTLEGQLDACRHKIEYLESRVSDLIAANNELVKNVNMLMNHPLFKDIESK